MIDIHAHLWGEADGLTPRPGDEPALTEMADRYGIEQLVVLPLFGGMTPTPEQVAAGNRAVRELAKRDARMLPFVTVFLCRDTLTMVRALGPMWSVRPPGPPLKVGVALTGAGDMNVSVEEALRTPNLYLELCFSVGTPWQIETLVEAVEANRLVWGSDTLLFAASHQIGRVAFAQISKDSKRRIIGANARRIFHI